MSTQQDLATLNNKFYYLKRKYFNCFGEGSHQIHKFYSMALTEFYGKGNAAERYRIIKQKVANQDKIVLKMKNLTDFLNHADGYIIGSHIRIIDKIAKMLEEKGILRDPSRLAKNERILFEFTDRVKAIGREEIRAFNKRIYGPVITEELEKKKNLRNPLVYYISRLPKKKEKTFKPKKDQSPKGIYTEAKKTLIESLKQEGISENQRDITLNQMLKFYVPVTKEKDLINLKKQDVMNKSANLEDYMTDEELLTNSKIIIEMIKWIAKNKYTATKGYECKEQMLRIVNGHFTMFMDLNKKSPYETFVPQFKKPINPEYVKQDYSQVSFSDIAN